MKVAHVGCGELGKIVLEYLIDCNYEITAVYDIKGIGEDIGSLIGREETGIKVRDIAEFNEGLVENKPEVCTVSTRSRMALIEDVMRACAENGVNMITSCEEAMFPMNSAPEVTKKIDALAKAHNCTITGSGYQDGFWGEISTLLAGTVHKIESIRLVSQYGVDDYGFGQAAQQHGAGLTLEEFEEKMAAPARLSLAEVEELIQKGEYEPSYMWNTNGWVCERMGLTPVMQKQEHFPTIAEVDIESQSLNKTIEKGITTGTRSVVTTKTKEGIDIIFENVGKIYAPGEKDFIEWEIIGTPNLKIVSEELDIMGLTAGAMVNRIPDVLRAEAGFVATSAMSPMCNVFLNK